MVEPPPPPRTIPRAPPPPETTSRARRDYDEPRRERGEGEARSRNPRDPPRAAARRGAPHSGRSAARSRLPEFSPLFFSFFFCFSFRICASIFGALFLGFLCRVSFLERRVSNEGLFPVARGVGVGVGFRRAIKTRTDGCLDEG